MSLAAASHVACMLTCRGGCCGQADALGGRKSSGGAVSLPGAAFGSRGGAAATALDHQRAAGQAIVCMQRFSPDLHTIPGQVLLALMCGLAGGICGNAGGVLVV